MTKSHRQGLDPTGEAEELEQFVRTAKNPIVRAVPGLLGVERSVFVDIDEAADELVSVHEGIDNVARHLPVELHLRLRRCVPVHRRRRLAYAVG